MANEILAGGTSGDTLYAVVRDSVSRAWNGTAFEAFNASNWATYAVTLAEQGTSGDFVGTFPAAAAGVYSVQVRRRAGGSPAQSDERVAGGYYAWDGSALVGAATAKLAGDGLRTALVAGIDNADAEGVLYALAMMVGSTRRLTSATGDHPGPAFNARSGGGEVTYANPSAGTATATVTPPA